MTSKDFNAADSRQPNFHSISPANRPTTQVNSQPITNFIIVKLKKNIVKESTFIDSIKHEKLIKSYSPIHKKTWKLFFAFLTLSARVEVRQNEQTVHTIIRSSHSGK